MDVQWLIQTKNKVPAYNHFTWNKYHLKYTTLYIKASTIQQYGYKPGQTSLFSHDLVILQKLKGGYTPVQQEVEYNKGKPNINI